MFTAAPSPTLRQNSSHRQTRILLFAGFGGLLLLMSVLGISAISFLYQLEVRETAIRQDYVSRDRALETLRANIYASGTYVRDFLLDTSDSLASAHRMQFLDTRRQIERGIADYRRLLRTEERTPFQQLTDELTAYFNALTPVLRWTARERHDQAYGFMQDELLPRRIIALDLADRIQQVSQKQLEVSSEAVSGMLTSFRAKLLLLLVFTLMIGLAFAGVALWRLLHLEHESQRRFAEAVTAREETKRLSGELVSAQESERRRISRELHDEVGQVLSAIMLGLGNLRSALHQNNADEAQRQLQLVQDMTERNAIVVRNLSLLLRPTMLDDLGLVPALKWLAREASRTGTMMVDVVADSFVDLLPEEYRTCIFRVVQEAVRNAVRHSGARQTRIYVQVINAGLRVSVQDDGKGFAPEEEKGLGVLGMDERVARLAGKLRVDSKRGGGTIVSFELPLPESVKNGEIPAEDHFHEISPFRTA
jgi:signal transduction histidine kinase